jgi:hypothetical protein
MTTGTQSGHLIPAIIAIFCATVLIATVSWFVHTGHAGQTGARGGAVATAHVAAGQPLASGVDDWPWT